MLKKFDLLVEEVTKSIINDCRFKHASRFLVFNLTPEEKAELNEKYNVIVKEELEEAAKSKKPLTIFYCNDNFSVRIPNAIVTKVFEEDGKTYCEFWKSGCEQIVKRINEEYTLEKFKKNNPTVTQEQVDEWKNRELDRYRKIMPIEYITTEKIINLMLDYRDKLKSFDKEKYYPLFEKVDSNLKYLIDKNYLNKDDILNNLSLIRGAKKSSSIIYDFNDEKLLEIFNVDKNDKNFELAKNSSKQSGESWYYNGGTKLVLKVNFLYEEGKRFDINRMKYDFSYYYERSSGNGTAGDF